MRAVVSAKNDDWFGYVVTVDNREGGLYWCYRHLKGTISYAACFGYRKSELIFIKEE